MFLPARITHHSFQSIKFIEAHSALRTGLRRVFNAPLVSRRHGVNPFSKAVSEFTNYNSLAENYDVNFFPTPKISFTVYDLPEPGPPARNMALKIAGSLTPSSTSLLSRRSESAALGLTVPTGALKTSYPYGFSDVAAGIR